jgi:RNA polymerase sigma-70 factor (ECF subfamily)
VNRPTANLTDGADEMLLIRAAKQGDIVAFEQLVQRHSRQVFRVALHIARRHEDAEEITQETFLKAFQHLKRFEERARISTWLTRIALNVALSRLPKSRREPAVSTSEDAGAREFGEELIADWRPNPEEFYSRSELADILKQALESLPTTYSTVFLLRDVEGLSISETCQALGLSEPAVKTRLARARLQLRQRLSQHFRYGRSPKGPAVDRLSSELQSMVT